MSERERWIVYPLLFLALGAALRDKLINSTESQRIKCQGLMVYDSSGQVSMVLGAEQFPDELRQGARNMLLVDQLHVTEDATTNILNATTVASKNTITNNLKAATLDTENATANNLKATTVVSENLSMGKLAYVDRQQGLTYSISGPNVIRLLAWLDQFQRYATQVSSMMQQRQQQQQQQRGQVAPGTIPGRRPASGLETPQEAAPEASPPADPAPSGTSAAGEGGAAPNSEEQGAVRSNE